MKGLRNRRAHLVHILVAAVLIAGGTCAAEAAAQEDSVTVVPGAHYAAGGLGRFLLGSRYRDHWTRPIRVPVLRPDTFAGGLTLLQRGGGRQTLSLRFATDDGREWVFRSVDKNQSGGLPEDLHDTLVEDIIQDQISSKHPGAAPLVASLLDAAGVLHAEPRLAVMADHPELGEYRDEFAGMLGMIEERPTEVEDETLRFGRYERLIGTERLLERVEESAEDRVDSRAFLAARLMDLLVGDWDRHSDQWRWAQDDRNGRRFWLPIPRDRDNAFYYVDGVIGAVGGALRPFVVRYEDEYEDLYGLTYNAQHLDRRFLTELPREVWDSVAMDLQGRLTNDVIANAVRSMPPEYWELSGAELEQKLRARRDALPEVAGAFYLQTLREAEVHLTDDDEQVTVERLADGAVRVTASAESGGAAPYYERIFYPAETREVRIDLRGGDDHARVTGEGKRGLLVRVIGGGADDHLEDAAPASAGRTVLYDDLDDEDVFVQSDGTVVDRGDYEPRVEEVVTQNNNPGPRHWGSSSTMFTPDADWRSEIGPVIGGGPQATRYGFRRQPFATRVGGSVRWAPLHNRFEVAAEAVRVWTGGRGATRAGGSASQIALTRFHGYGNETSDGPDPHVNRVWATRYDVGAELTRYFGGGVEATVGPIAAYVDPEPQPGSPAEIGDVPGSSRFGLAGLQGGAIIDRRDSAGFPTRGAEVVARGEWYAGRWGDAPEPFATTELTASAYLPVPFPWESILAVRGGGERVWGNAPFQYAASVGGGSSLRGYRTDRFTGDAALFGSAELRTTLGRVNMLIARGDIGTIALADAGRVYVDGQNSDVWHTAVGGGLWVGLLDRALNGYLVVVRGERTKLRAGLGVPF